MYVCRTLTLEHCYVSDVLGEKCVSSACVNRRADTRPPERAVAQLDTNSLDSPVRPVALKSEGPATAYARHTESAAAYVLFCISTAISLSKNTHAASLR